MRTDGTRRRGARMPCYSKTRLMLQPLFARQIRAAASYYHPLSEDAVREWTHGILNAELGKWVKEWGLLRHKGEWFRVNIVKPPPLRSSFGTERMALVIKVRPDIAEQFEQRHVHFGKWVERILGKALDEHAAKLLKRFEGYRREDEDA